MGELGAFGGQGLIMEIFGGFGIERQMELVAPAEFETGFGQRIVTLARRG